MTTRLDAARRCWGAAFSDFRLAHEAVNSAWYEVDDKQSLMDEDIRRLQGLIRDAQKVIDAWKTEGKP